MRPSDIKTYDEALKLIKNREPDEYEKLLQDNHSLVALAMLNTVGVRKTIESIPFTWINHLGEATPSTLLIAAIEKATNSMSYEDAMKYFLSIAHQQKIHLFIATIIMKRIQSDQIFRQSLELDNIYLPILSSINPAINKLLPSNLARPMTNEAKEYLANDRLHQLHFDKSTLTKHQQDIAAISSLLSDEALMLKQLDKLEKALNKSIRKRNSAAKLPLKPLLGNSPELFTKPYTKEPNNPFLFGFFSEWAAKHDFDELIRLMNFQDDDDFIEYLRQGTLYKDNALGGEFHGAWTHLLQWYCIVSAYESGDLNLNESPANVLRSIGEHADPQNSIWRQTFEVPKSVVSDPHDFRNVFHLNDYINHDEIFAERCPTLQALIRIRTIKDEEKSKNKPY